MKFEAWRKKIKTATETVGTYQESFNDVIDTLAMMLEERDRVYQQYVNEGSQPLVLVVSDRGQENMRNNPLLTTWRDINRDALQYWRDLGLTPAGLKKIVDDSMKAPESSPLDKVLASLEQQSQPAAPKKRKAPAAKPKTKTPVKKKTVKKTTAKTVAKTKTKGQSKVKK